MEFCTNTFLESCLLRFFVLYFTHFILLQWWILRLDSCSRNKVKRKGMHKGEKVNCWLCCCCSRAPVVGGNLLPGHFFTRTRPGCFVKGMPSWPLHLPHGCTCIEIRVGMYRDFLLHFTLSLRITGGWVRERKGWKVPQMVLGRGH